MILPWAVRRLQAAGAMSESDVFRAFRGQPMAGFAGISNSRSGFDWALLHACFFQIVRREQVHELPSLSELDRLRRELIEAYRRAEDRDVFCLDMDTDRPSEVATLHCVMESTVVRVPYARRSRDIDFS